MVKFAVIHPSSGSLFYSCFTPILYINYDHTSVYIFYYKLISLLPETLKNKSSPMTVVSVRMVDSAAAVP